MNYYSISFGYIRNEKQLNIDAASQENFAAAKIARDALTKAGLEHKHQYSWPDGSLYMWVRTSLSADDVYSEIMKAVPNNGIFVHVVDVEIVQGFVDPDMSPFKTLEEYMNASAFPAKE